MYKLLIVDDEPLVQAGLKSMLNWPELEIELCKIAGNGKIAYDIILEEKPDIVIADIRMPVMSGLELMKKCREDMGELPVFILLTSYEEFSYAREALRYHVIEYLVKLELTADTLKNAVEKSISEVKKYKSEQNTASNAEPAAFDLSLFQDRFYIRLLNNLLESEKEFTRQSQELKITFEKGRYAAAHLELISPVSVETSQEKQLVLYHSTLQMFHEILSKYMPCRVLSLDLRYLAVIFFMPENDSEDLRGRLENALIQTAQMLHNYYNVTILSAIGRTVTDPLDLPSSYRDAKQLAPALTKSQPLLFIDDLPSYQGLRNIFDMSVFRDPIRKAFDEFDETALHEVFTSIYDLFASDQLHFTQAMDAASNILHLTITMLGDGQEVAAAIFENEPDGYRSLYRQTTVNRVLDWLHQLDDGLCTTFAAQKKNYKNHIVASVKKYVNAHINEHLTLQSLAFTFSISPNYLSQLFKKFSDIGFNEYVTQMKIEKARQMLLADGARVYEVAEALGFESAFYFSKVFKKITGIPPKDSRNHTLNGR